VESTHIIILLELDIVCDKPEIFLGKGVFILDFPNQLDVNQLEIFVSSAQLSSYLSLQSEKWGVSRHLNIDTHM